LPDGKIRRDKYSGTTSYSDQIAFVSTENAEKIKGIRSEYEEGKDASIEITSEVIRFKFNGKTLEVPVASQYPQDGLSPFDLSGGKYPHLGDPVVSITSTSKETTPAPANNQQNQEDEEQDTRSPEEIALQDEFDKHTEKVDDLYLNEAEVTRAQVKSVVNKLLKAGAIDEQDAQEILRVVSDKGYDRADAVSEAIGLLQSSVESMRERKLEEVLKSKPPTQAPAPTVDTAAIVAEVAADPEAHKTTKGKQKLISRKAAVALLSQLPDTLTNKDVATLAKNSGTTSTNLRKLAALAGTPDAASQIMSGAMDSELGLFDSGSSTKSEQPPTDTDTDTDISGGTLTDRWVDTAFKAIEAEVAKTNKSRGSLNLDQLRSSLRTPEGQSKIRESLAKIFNYAMGQIGIPDPVVMEAALRKIFYGEKSQTDSGITGNVLEDLLFNIRKTGDPFFTRNNKGEVVPYSAWKKHRNKREEFLNEAAVRDSQSEDGEGVEDAPASETVDIDKESREAEYKRMRGETIRRTYEEIAVRWAEKTGKDIEDVKIALLKILSEQSGIQINAETLGWGKASRNEKTKPTVKKALEDNYGDIFSDLNRTMKQALDNLIEQAKDEGVIRSDAVPMPDLTGTPTLEDLIEAGLIDQQRSARAVEAAKKAGTPEALLPLLKQIDPSEIQKLVGRVLNKGKVITDPNQIVSLTAADMQAVLDSGILPDWQKEVLQALNDLSGRDGLGLVKGSKNEGFRLLGELYSRRLGEQRTPVQVVFNMALNPGQTGQGMWDRNNPNKVHISPFLTRDSGIMDATILHEVAHPIWDKKIRDYTEGNLSALSEKDVAVLRELEGLFVIAKTEARKRIDATGDPKQKAWLIRNLLGADPMGDSPVNLSEFLNEALNHKPFQDFLNELKDPNSKEQISLFRRILNNILKLLRGGDVALDSVLQRSFELSVKLAGDKPRIERAPANLDTRQQADELAGRVLSEGELANYNQEKNTGDQPILSSQISLNDFNPDDVRTIEALTGQPPTQDETNRIAESQAVSEPVQQSQYRFDTSEPAGTPTGFEATDESRTLRGKAQAAGRMGGGEPSQTNIGRDAARSSRTDVTQGTELTGDGRSFADFFAKVTGNKDARFIPVNSYRPAIPLGRSAAEFKAERDKHRGNFDAHISTSIPGFDEVQSIVGAAILKTHGQTGADLLDIGTSEGALIKALAAKSNGAIRSVGIDPNLAMEQTFRSKSQVPGAVFDFAAFGSSEDAGKVAWVEEDGTEVYTFDPAGRTFDVIHEAMVFQFISNSRNAQVARVKELMKPGGIAIFEEKFGDFANEYDASENQKDSDWKALFFTPEQIQAKQQEVLSRGGDEIEGMTDKQVAWWEMESVLGSNFANVVQFWSSGNFRGYAASDDAQKLQEFVSNMQPTDTVFSKQDTPRRVLLSKEIGPDQKFQNYAQVISYIQDKFGRAADVLGTDISYNFNGVAARYVVIDDYGRQHQIEYNPLRMLTYARREIDAAMREELIHAASGLALKKRGIDWVEFYDDLGNVLSAKERASLKSVYTSTRNMANVGAEFFRVSVQKLLYGTITEAERKTPAMQKILNLLKAVVNFWKGKRVDPVVQEVYDDTVRMMKKADKSGIQKSESVPEMWGRIWQEAVAKEGGDAFAYGEVSPQVKSFTEIFTAVTGEEPVLGDALEAAKARDKDDDAPRQFAIGFYLDGADATEKEFEKAVSENGLNEVWIKDPDGGVTVFFTSGASASSGIYSVNSAGTKSRPPASSETYAVNSAGTKSSGSQIYQSLYAWAHNNGKIVGPDSSLSKVAEIRRTSQMLSSALRFGTTQHMRPSAEQQIKGWRRVEVDKNGVPWEVSGTLREVGRLIYIDDTLDSVRPRRTDGRLTGAQFNQYNEFQTDTGLATFTQNDSDPNVMVRNYNGYEVRANRLSMEEAQRAWRENIGLLAEKESELVFERIPELKRLNISKDGYLLGPDTELPGSTRALPAGNIDEYFESLSAEISRTDPDFAERIGTATLARALATRYAQANKSSPTLRAANAEGPGSEIGAETFSPFRGTLYSAAYQPMPAVLPGFVPTAYTQADREETEALSRVLSDPSYASIRSALQGKQYFAYTEAETSRVALDFIDNANGGDLQKAFINSGTSGGLTFEQTVLVRGIAMKRAQEAANKARQERLDPSTSASRRKSLLFIEQKWSDMAEDFAETLMEMGSLAGQELRAFRLLADTLAPRTWRKAYQTAAIKARNKALKNDPVFKEMLTRINYAKKKAANDTTDRMLKALAVAAKGFLPKKLSRELLEANEKYARLLASQLPVREEIMAAAVEQTVLSGLDTIKDALAPDEQVPDSFLRAWENRLRTLATEQLTAAIEQRLQGGKVDPERDPNLTEEEREQMRTQKILDAWREVSDLPIAETVFNLSRAWILSADTPYDGLVRRVKFDPAKSSSLRKAVRVSIDTAAEIRKSLFSRRMSVEALQVRLGATNPQLTQEQLGRLAAAVEAVYNEEIKKATRAELDAIIRRHSQEKTAKKLTEQNTIEKLLPLVNMGGLSEEAVYNAVAEDLGLPSWNSGMATEIERRAEELQKLPEGSNQRQEAAQQLLSDILKANVKEGLKNLKSSAAAGYFLQIGSALWSAGILSAPPTHIINTGMSAVSVFVESLAEATGYYLNARIVQGREHEQAKEYFKDMARAWLFAFGKDANNTSLRAINEAYSSLTRGRSRFKAEKLENLSPLEMFNFDPRVAIPGNKMMEAVMAKDGNEAFKQAMNTATGVVSTMQNRLQDMTSPNWRRGVKEAAKDYGATMKMVGRLMLAADAVNSYGASVAKQLMIRRYLAQQEGLPETQINQIMQDTIKGGTAEVRQEAINQVENEADRGDFGPKGTTAHEVAKARRLEQIIEQQTFTPDAVNAGRDFAAIATFNSDPYGMVGWLMDTLFAGPTKVLGLATKPINPFPKTMSNLLNAALNYSPVGSLRAEGWNISNLIAGTTPFPQQFVRETPERGTPEYIALHTRAAAGTSFATIIFLMLMSAVKDRREKREPWFEVHGPGPSDPDKLKQFLASGAKKFSLRVGKVVFNYTDWPALNLILGVLGTLYDQMVYSESDMAITDWVSQAAWAIALTTLNRNALGGASALFEILSASTPDQVRQSRFKQIASSYVTGFTRPSFVRWAETTLTGQRQETGTTEGWLLSMLPVASMFRDRPALNILGEPIEISRWDNTAGRVASLQKSHPVLSPLTTAGLYINPPQRYEIYDSSSPSTVRKMTDAEFYDYTKVWGETMRGVLTPEVVGRFTELSKTAPNTAQDILNTLTSKVGQEARVRVAQEYGRIKGKEVKGP
jgi:SAM-dependent methyltransferase